MSRKPKPIQDATATDTEPGVPRVLDAWPALLVTVSYRETTYAFGRKAVAELGYEEFMKELFRTLVWKHLPYQSDFTRDFNASLFKRNALLFGAFCTIQGERDVGPRPVVLGHLGWVVMVENVISMELVYDEKSTK